MSFRRLRPGICLLQVQTLNVYSTRVQAYRRMFSIYPGEYSDIDVYFQGNFRNFTEQHTAIRRDVILLLNIAAREWILAEDRQHNQFDICSRDPYYFAFLIVCGSQPIQVNPVNIE